MTSTCAYLMIKVSRKCHAEWQKKGKKGMILTNFKNANDHIARFQGWAASLTSKGSLVQSQSCPPLNSLISHTLTPPCSFNGNLQVIFCHATVTHPQAAGIEPARELTQQHTSPHSYVLALRMLLNSACFAQMLPRMLPGHHKEKCR